MFRSSRRGAAALLPCAVAFAEKARGTLPPYGVQWGGVGGSRDILLLDIGEQLTIKPVNTARKRRMLAQRVEFHRFSTPSSAST